MVANSLIDWLIDWLIEWPRHRRLTGKLLLKYFPVALLVFSRRVRSQFLVSNRFLCTSVRWCWPSRPSTELLLSTSKHWSNISWPTGSTIAESNKTSSAKSRLFSVLAPQWWNELQRQDSRITLRLPRKTQDSFVQTSPPHTMTPHWCTCGVVWFRFRLNNTNAANIKNVFVFGSMFCCLPSLFVTC